MGIIRPVYRVFGDNHAKNEEFYKIRLKKRDREILCPSFAWVMVSDLIPLCKNKLFLAVCFLKTGMTDDQKPENRVRQLMLSKGLWLFGPRRQLAG